MARSYDNAPDHYNPDQADVNHDGVGDAAQIPTITVEPAVQTVQYSDAIATITVDASDPDSNDIELSDSGLPSDIAHPTVISTTWPEGGVSQRCEIGGRAMVPAGDYPVTFTVTDPDGFQASATVTITVEPEDASVEFDMANPTALQVASPGGNSGPFGLTLWLSDAPESPVLPGDISLADAEVVLQPVGPGAPVPGIVSPTASDGRVDVAFDDVEPNVYAVAVTVSGGYYTGFGEDVLTVYDPSLGGASGGGWFYWPGTDERANFGFTMKYNRRGKKVQGNLLIIRHGTDGTHHRLKSNALDGLALSEGGDFAWASFTGKATYAAPGWAEPVGNYAFRAYVEDWGEPGTGVDTFWIETRDKDGLLVSALSMSTPAEDNAETINGGNVRVAAPGGNKRK
jgi:hypothetical protein